MTPIHPAQLLTTCTLAGALALAGCGGGDGGGNPERLYLAPRGSEVNVQLVGDEPDPF
ncbi:MAG TPA: hypothetical protein VKB80_26025 [Kofleriaceae bacterium]|nr:hypothetical protein [Kofleriaceae bacterium]